MTEKRKSLAIGLAAAGFLSLSIGAQVLTSHQEIVTMKNLTHEVKNVSITIKQQTLVQKQMQQAALAKEIQALKVATFEDNGITEEFKITEVTNDGYVRGEKTEGTGEGIYYNQDFFADNVGKLAVGDVIQITWTPEAYEVEDWENVEKIEKIIE